jgi:LacI family transcriptional regulator
MVTLADVARRAGVSQSTVSRIVNGSAKLVTDDLRARVLRAVEELQYVPNAHAQQLARSQRSAVGVIVHDVSDPYFAEIARGLQRVATANGCLVIICNSYRDPDRELQYVELLRAHQVAAIVLAGSGYHDAAFTKALDVKLAAYVRTGGRVTVIGRHKLASASVVPDNVTGAYLIGSEVFGLGHRRVGLIAGPRALTTTTDRIAGVRWAAREHRCSVPRRRIEYADFDRDSGAAATARLLDANPSLTAIVALNDSMAIGALATLRSRGITVPAQMSVVGFDDMPIACDVTPALTTVRLPLAEMGARAMTLALEPVGGDPPTDGTHRVERMAATVVRRDSMGPPPR